jgi:hypothetical protein
MLPAAVVLACVLANILLSHIRPTSCARNPKTYACIGRHDRSRDRRRQALEPLESGTPKSCAETKASYRLRLFQNVQLAHRAYNPTPCTRVCTPIPVDRLKAWQTFSCKVETDSVPGDGLPTWSSWFSSCIRSIRSTQPSDKQPRSFTHSSAVLQLPLLCFLHCLSLIVLALQVLVTVHCKPQTAPKGDPRCVSPP